MAGLDKGAVVSQTRRPFFFFLSWTMSMLTLSKHDYGVVLYLSWPIFVMVGLIWRNVLWNYVWQKRSKAYMTASDGAWLILNIFLAENYHEPNLTFFPITSLIIHSFIHSFMRVCMWAGVCTCHRTWVDITGPLRGIWSLLPAHWVPRDCTQVVRPADMCLNSWRHLAGSSQTSFPSSQSCIKWKLLWETILWKLGRLLLRFVFGSHKENRLWWAGWRKTDWKEGITDCYWVHTIYRLGTRLQSHN